MNKTTVSKPTTTATITKTKPIKPEPNWVGIGLIVLGLIILVFILASYSTPRKKATGVLLDVIITGSGALVTYGLWRRNRKETYIVGVITVVLLLITIFWFMSYV